MTRESCEMACVSAELPRCHLEQIQTLSHNIKSLQPAVSSPRGNKAFSNTVASFQAFMPSHRPPRWELWRLFVYLDRLLNWPLFYPHPPHPPLPCACCTPQPVVSLSHATFPLLLFLPTPLLVQRSSSSSLTAVSALRHSLSGSRRAQRETRPSSGGCRTRPRSLTRPCRGPTFHSGQGHRGSQTEEIRLSMMQFNEEYQCGGSFCFSQGLVIKWKALIILLRAFSPPTHTFFNLIFRHVTVSVHELIGNLFSAVSLINTH